MTDVFKKLAGTVLSYFKLGVAGPRLKNNSGSVEARNNADSAFAVVRGATPVGNDDLVTKSYGDANYSGTGFTEATLSTNDANYNAIASISVASDTVVSISAFVVGKEKSGGSGRCFFHAEALFYRTGSAALVQDGNTNSITTRRNPNQLRARFSISSNSIVIEVRGIAATNYDWRVKYFTIEEDG